MGPSYRKAAVITAINRHRWLWANGELPVFLGQPGTALQQLKLPMRQKRNGLGACAATCVDRIKGKGSSDKGVFRQKRWGIAHLAVAT